MRWANAALRPPSFFESGSHDCVISFWTIMISCPGWAVRDVRLTVVSHLTLEVHEATVDHVMCRGTRRWKRCRYFQDFYYFLGRLGYLLCGGGGLEMQYVSRNFLKPTSVPLSLWNERYVKQAEQSKFHNIYIYIYLLCIYTIYIQLIIYKYN